MAGILARLTGSRKLSLAQRHQMLLRAMQLHRDGTAEADVDADLRAAGASQQDATTISAEAHKRTDEELSRSVSLPQSSRGESNYYFLLGVTPNATLEQIHRAYRRKAKEIHPDQHHGEFTRESWNRLMTLIGEAHQVLTDTASRRAYDIFWRERSRRVAIENRRKGQLRGDWETRYRWEMAELAEVEEQMGTLVEELETSLRAGSPPGAMKQAIESAVETYEAKILEIRTQTHALPPVFLRFGDTVRYEMQRKDRLVQGLSHLCVMLPDTITPAGADALAPEIASAKSVIEDVRRAQHQFEVDSARV